MNRKFNELLIFIILVMLLAAVCSPTIAGVKDCEDPKWESHPACTGTDPDPDPEPDPVIDGSACADSESFFPAFAYMVSTHLDNDPYAEYTEIFLSNAEGNCAIQIYGTSDDYRAIQLSYRFFSNNTGRIVFTESKFIDDLWAAAPNQIRMLDFSINEGAIVEELPLSSTVLAKAPDVDGIRDGSIYMPDLSPMGNRVVFVGLNGDGDIYFIDEIEIACASEMQCRQRVFETQSDVAGEAVYLANPHYSLEKDRIYFELGHPLKKVVFIEKEGGIWPALDYDSEDPSLSSDPTLILDGEGDVLKVRSVGLWDYNGSGAREVIAMPRRITSDLDSIEILDVEACLETDPPGSDSCVVLGVGSESGITIEGDTLLPVSFTSFNENPPALLLRKYVGRPNESSSILEANLNDYNEQILINAVKDRKKFIGSVDSAD